MFQVTERLRRIAKKVMDNALPIKRDQVAVFYAGTDNLNLAYAFAAECETRGIETLIQSEGDYISHRKLLNAPIQTFKKIPKIPKALVDVADWFIWMSGSSFDRSIYQKPEYRKRLVKVQQVSKWSRDNLLQLCLEKKTHFLAFLDPNLQQAQALQKSYEETFEMFLDSLDIDYDALTELGRRIINLMSKGGEIHVTCRRGTDLKLCADGRYWYNEDGKLAPSSAPVANYIHNLPVGETFVAPIEDSAHGTLCPKDLPGSMSKDIRIEFDAKGKATISAKKGFEFIKSRLEKAKGNPYCIAEFAFGTNPCGNMLLATEKAYGTCHVAIGQNTWLGGKNECSVHWDFLIDKPTVTLNRKLVLKNGKFIV